MPDPISSSASSFCNPRIASCEDSAPLEAASRKAAGQPVVIDPVVITGDAGAQALLLRYDASQACGPEKQSATLSCPAIGLGVISSLRDPLAGLVSAFHSSLVCGKDLRALSDCGDQAEALQSSAAQVIANCHDRGGTVSAGPSTTEIVCEVAP